MLDRLGAPWTTEPARLISILVTLLTFAATKAGVVDQQGLAEAITLALLILLGGEATRTRVTPTTGKAGPDSDSLLDLDRL
jgi:hypothetical protein